MCAATIDPDMDETRSTIFAVAAVALLVGATFGAAIGTGFAGSTQTPPVRGGTADWQNDGDGSLERFESAETFESYFQAAERSGIRWFGGGVTMSAGADGEEVATDDAVSYDAEGSQSRSAGTTDHSETNVQEGALDEPDVLKTDGESAYYAGYRFQRTGGETNVLDLENPGDPTVVATIPATGGLLLVEETDTLVVLGAERIRGYDVSDPANPQQIWDEPLEADLESARLFDGDLYLVLVDRPDRADPCPIAGYGDDPVACTDVYRPGDRADADAVYTAARVDPATGTLEDEASVVGSTRHSATYVSEKAIYLTYTRSVSEYQVLSGYLTGPGATELGLDANTLERLESLDDLDISERAKTVELREIQRDWFASLDDEARQNAQQTFEEGLAEYADSHQRDLTTTGIARISIEGDLDVTESGEVPGTPLNQWSMDEHEGHLRIATTIPGMYGAGTENDVYVLDSALEVTGSVEGLGETERIYAVRFEGEEGYVVTFRQIDPFYTLDLSDPSAPEMEGELKIPGFSTYLHPLDEEGNLVLGVGEQDGKVKLSTFDVSDRENPTELDAEILSDEHFSEAVRNHRAFLQDERYDAVFLPAGEASYVYSYADGELSEEARVDVGGPGVRAMYVAEYLYVIGEDDLVVLERGTWDVENRIDLR